MLVQQKARARLVFGFLCIVSLACGASASAAIVQKTPLSIITAFENTMKTQSSGVALGVLNTVLMPEDDMSSHDLNAVNITSKKLVTTLKALRLAIVKPVKYVKPETVDGLVMYRLTGNLTQVGTYNGVQALLPLINASDLSPREFNSIKFVRKYVTGGKVQILFGASDYVPTKLYLTWTTVDPKFKNKVVNELAVNLKSYVAVVVKPKILTLATKTVQVSKDATTTESSLLSDATQESEHPQTIHVVNPEALPKAVDANGNGGVVVVSSGDTLSTLGRDNQIINDMNAIQTALKLFYNDNNFYPSAAGLLLGQGAAMCLNEDGWMSADNCPYPYMVKVPNDPKGVSYTYSGGGMAYLIGGKLEGEALGLKGTIKLTPNGFAQQ